VNAISDTCLFSVYSIRGFTLARFTVDMYTDHTSITDSANKIVFLTYVFPVIAADSRRYGGYIHGGSPSVRPSVRHNIVNAITDSILVVIVLALLEMPSIFWLPG
jgi:hypothetical protein